MLIIELQYFPSVITYSTLIKKTNINFSLYENYRRRSFRNRCIIAGANGPISLSIPIAGGRNKKEIYKNVRIDYSTDWQQNHWRSISSAYGNSPWFFHYVDSLEKLYSQKVEYLVEWNFLCMDWVNRSFGIIMVPLEKSEVTFGEWGNFWKVSELLESRGLLESGGLLESRGLLESLGPFEELGGLAEVSANHEDFISRKTARMEDEILDWRDRIVPSNFQKNELGTSPVYTQVFEERFGFQPNLSILDFIFCSGKSQLNKLLI